MQAKMNPRGPTTLPHTLAPNHPEERRALPGPKKMNSAKATQKTLLLQKSCSKKVCSTKRCSTKSLLLQKTAPQNVCSERCCPMQKSARKVCSKNALLKKSCSKQCSAQKALLQKRSAPNKVRPASAPRRVSWRPRSRAATPEPVRLEKQLGEGAATRPHSVRTASAQRRELGATE